LGHNASQILLNGKKTELPFIVAENVKEGLISYEGVRITSAIKQMNIEEIKST